jgi:hypothetical protein
MAFHTQDTAWIQYKVMDLSLIVQYADIGAGVGQSTRFNGQCSRAVITHADPVERDCWMSRVLSSKTKPQKRLLVFKSAFEIDHVRRSPLLPRMPARRRRPPQRPRREVVPESTSNRQLRRCTTKPLVQETDLVTRYCHSATQRVAIRVLWIVVLTNTRWWRCPRLQFSPHSQKVVVHHRRLGERLQERFA